MRKLNDAVCRADSPNASHPEKYSFLCDECMEAFNEVMEFEAGYGETIYVCAGCLKFALKELES